MVSVGFLGLLFFSYTLPVGIFWWSHIDADTPPQFTIREILVAQIALTPSLIWLSNASDANAPWAVLTLLIHATMIVLGAVFNQYWHKGEKRRKYGTAIQGFIAVCAWTIAILVMPT